MLKPPVFGKEKSDSIILELIEQSFRIALFASRSIEALGTVFFASRDDGGQSNL